MAAAAFLWLGCARPAEREAAPAATDRFEIALIGDQQYWPETDVEFDRILAAIDAAPVSFVVHVGDIKDSAAPCTDSLYQLRRSQFDRSAHPFVLLFGDNDWYDCFLSGSSPIERLSRLRELFASGDSSLGRSRMPLERQGSDASLASSGTGGNRPASPESHPENVRWERGRVLFIGLNLPGNQKPWRGDAVEQAAYERLLQANVEWLREGFRLARTQGMRGVMVLFQANPLFDRSSLPELTKRRLVDYDPLLDALRQETLAFGRPVALVHGDLHYFLIDMPLRDSTSSKVIPLLTRVQVFGDPNAHWVRGTVDPADPQVFRFSPVVVPENAPPSPAGAPSVP